MVVTSAGVTRRVFGSFEKMRTVFLMVAERRSGERV